MYIQSFFDGGYGSMCYLVTDAKRETAVVIDPSISPSAVRQRAGTLPVVTAILLTHGHFDHVLALDAWREETGAPVLIGAPDGTMLTDPGLSCYRSFLSRETTHAPAERLLSEGERIPLGEETLAVMMTPGHTAGSCVYVTDGAVFTGDTVFAYGGYGRYDLPSGSAAHLIKSIHKILSLPEDYRVYPGHGCDTTIGAERPYHAF